MCRVCVCCVLRVFRGFFSFFYRSGSYTQELFSAFFSEFNHTRSKHNIYQDFCRSNLCHFDQQCEPGCYVGFSNSSRNCSSFHQGVNGRYLSQPTGLNYGAPYHYVTQRQAEYDMMHHFEPYFRRTISSNCTNHIPRILNRGSQQLNSSQSSNDQSSYCFQESEDVTFTVELWTKNGQYGFIISKEKKDYPWV